MRKPVVPFEDYGLTAAEYKAHRDWVLRGGPEPAPEVVERCPPLPRGHIRVHRQRGSRSIGAVAPDPVRFLEPCWAGFMVGAGRADYAFLVPQQSLAQSTRPT